MNRDRPINIVMIAADHDYSCRCENCLKFWVYVGPENHEDLETDDPKFGPFNKTEVAEMAISLGVDPWWMKAG